MVESADDSWKSLGNKLKAIPHRPEKLQNQTVFCLGWEAVGPRQLRTVADQDCSSKRSTRPHWIQQRLVLLPRTLGLISMTSSHAPRYELLKPLLMVELYLYTTHGRVS